MGENYEKFYILLATILTFACGETEIAADPVTSSGVTKSIGNIPPEVIITYDEHANRYKVTTDGSSLVLDRNSVRGGFEYTNPTGTIILAQKSVSKDAFVLAIASRYTELNFIGVKYGRNSATELPTSGIVTYSGRYMGLMGDASVRVGEVLVYGDLSVSVDFENMEISGEIINRDSVNVSSDFADVILAPTNLDSSAEFSGTPTGGTITDRGRGGILSTGEYAGLIAGANGEEIVIGIVIEYELDGVRQLETGGFVIN